MKDRINVQDGLNFGLRVEKLIDEKGYEKEWFFKKAELPKQSLYDWKRKSQTPNAEIAYVVAKTLDTTVEYLVTGLESEKDPKEQTIKKLKQRIIDIKNFVDKQL